MRSAAGAELLRTEVERVHAAVGNLFGYHCLQVGDLAGEDLLSASRILGRAIVDIDGGAPHGPYPLVRGAATALPIDSHAVDVVVLPHVLEFEPRPHDALRETSRVLVPEGSLLVLGFNPVSVIGLKRMLKHRAADAPWCGTYFSAGRLRDWLTLLGFDIVDQRPCFASGNGRDTARPANVRGARLRRVDATGAREREARRGEEARQRDAAGACALEAEAQACGGGVGGIVGPGGREVSDAVEIFTDGACRGNPGPGGWGAVLRYGEHERLLSGGASDTTNNRMELRAAIEALEALRRPCRVRLATDSTYVKNGITRWIAAWKRPELEDRGRRPGEEQGSLAAARAGSVGARRRMGLGEGPRRARGQREGGCAGARRG